MPKQLLIGFLPVAALAIAIGVGVNVLHASGEIAGVAFMLGAAIAGWIGGGVARRLPPPSQH